MNALIKILIILDVLVALSSMWGGWGLMTHDGLQLPKSWLAGTIFDNYFYPGLILFFIVGGIHLIAAIRLWLKKRYALELSAIASFGLVIWIATELYLLNHSNILQVIYFAIGMTCQVLIMVILRHKSVRSSFD